MQLPTCFWISCGVLLTNGWDHHARKRAATSFKLKWAEIEARHLLIFETYEQDVRAAEAVALFCYQVKKWIGAFAAALGGIDTLIFTGVLERMHPLSAPEFAKDSNSLE